MSATEQVELERTEAGTGILPEQPEGPRSGSAGETPPATTPASDSADLFTDAKGGLWAGITTAVCVGVVALGNLLLLAAAYGHDTAPDLWVLLGWGAAISAGVGVVAGVADAFLASRSEKWKAHRLTKPVRRAVELGVTAAVGTGVLVALLFGTAWLASRDKALAWQPVVGLSLSVVAVAAFGGFYLASRRSRVGFAASFVLTFLVLLSYMLTLEGLAAAANGSQEGALSASADSVRELLTDFRGSVALIVGFYFGTDAAVSAVKIWRTESKDAQDVGRLDRDLAVPRPAQSTLT